MKIIDFILQNGGGGGVTPSGTLSISSNGVYNVMSYASVDVSVAGDLLPSAINKTLTRLEYSDITAITTPGMFEFNLSLSYVSLPNCISLNSNVFHGCPITELYMPLLSSASSAVFWGTRMSSVSFPNLPYVNQTLFYQCTKLESYYLPAVTYVSQGGFQVCTALPYVTFPLVSYIGQYAFSGCSALSTAEFSILAKISNNAFRDCKSLMSLYLYSDSVCSASGANIFTNTPMAASSYTGAFGSVFVPASLVDSYKANSVWSSIADRITAIV